MFLDIPFDRPGLTPKEKRQAWQLVVIVAIGRSREESRMTTTALGSIDPEADLDAVPHPNLDVLFIDHGALPRLSGRVATRRLVHPGIKSFASSVVA